MHRLAPCRPKAAQHTTQDAVQNFSFSLHREHATRERTNDEFDEQQGWIAVANTALPIIGKHALEDVRAYLGLKASGASTWWKKALYAAGAVIAGAILGGLGMSLSGCGHSVDVTPNRAEVCKDGSCLVIEQGHISYSQAQPVTDVPPVVQIVPSKK